MSATVIEGVKRNLLRAGARDLIATLHDELNGVGLDGGVYLEATDREAINKLVAGHMTGPAGTAALRKLRGF